jgi:hypothetical protein
VGYHEIMGRRRRYRLPDLERLCWRLGTDDPQEVRRNWEVAPEEAIARDQVKREPIWTESLPIGSAGFVERIQPLLLTRRETEVIETAERLAVLQETPVSYRHKSPSEGGAKNPNEASFRTGSSQPTLCFCDTGPE